MRAEVNPLVRSGEDRWPDAGPVWRQEMRRLYDSIAKGLARTHLPGTIAVLDAIGRAANFAALHGPSSAEVAALYEWLPRRSLGPVARDISALHLKNRVATALVESDRTADLSKLVRWGSHSGHRAIVDGGAARLIVACHVGAFHGIRAALNNVDRPMLMLRDLPMSDAVSRSGALKRAVDHLRGGGLVVATLDGPGGTSTREVECLGRRIVLRRGPFTLARLTGAPLVPVVCAWTAQSEIEVRVAAPIECHRTSDRTATEIEEDMAVRTASWLDAYLRAEPQEIWLSTLRNYLAAPRAFETSD